MTATKSASESGRALYQAAWEMIGRKFFDTDRLSNWAEWERKFDEQIVSEESALDCISQMLASLGDTYTRLVETADATPVQEKESSFSSNESAEPIAVKGDVLARKLPNNIGYIRIFSFESPDIIEQVTDGTAAIADCDALIVDLRDNGGGAVDAACSCCEFFVIRGPVGSITRRLSDGRIWHRDVALFDEGTLFVTKVTGEEERMEGFMRRQPITAGKPVVVLINEGTASSAEMMAAAIVESDRSSGLVTCIGEPSFGKGIAQAQVLVMDKIIIQVTMARFMSPTDVWFGDAQQSIRNPVVPQLFVSGNTDAGPNAQLDAAFKWLMARDRRAA